MLCTGELVAYCADARETVAVIRVAGIAVVMGNVEESLGRDAADCGCGFTAGSACDVMAARWYAHAVAALDGDAKRWMRGLPRRIHLTIGGHRLAAIHGGVAAINSFVFPATPTAAKARELDLLGDGIDGVVRSEEHTSELQSLMPISYAVFRFNTKNNILLKIMTLTHRNKQHINC